MTGYPGRSVLVVSGATASGKSGLSIRLAQDLSGEVVNADSVQVYRGFDIGSAKLDPDEMQSVRHHLIDICEPDESMNAAKFSELASAACEEIFSQEKIPILVGGTTMYLNALLCGLADAPAADEKLRKKLEGETEKVLYDKLMSIDPERAKSLHPNDKFRVVRALETFYVTGLTPTQVFKQQQEDALSIGLNALMLVLCWPRHVLYERINLRTDQMIQQGVVEETQNLMDQAAGNELQALGSLGYAQVSKMLNGKLDESQLAEEIAKQTRRYSKRQMTFWRNEPAKRKWLQVPDQSDESNLQESRATMERAQKNLRDFSVLSLGYDDLLAKIQERLKSEIRTPEVWYLDAAKLF